jgi:hypothetical protein
LVNICGISVIDFLTEWLKIKTTKVVRANSGHPPHKKFFYINRRIIMPLFHSKYGFCMACCGPCRIQDELNFASDYHYQKTGVIIDTGYIYEPDAYSLLWEYRNRLNPPRLSFTSNFSNIDDPEDCCCGSGYNIFCPVHGLIKP